MIYNLSAVFNLSDTIAAIITPPGNGGIAAIRISGPDSWSLAKKFFYHTKKEGEVTKPRLQEPCFQHMQALHGYIKKENKIIDEIILLPYKALKSFTSEDVIEIFCHGGSHISSMILDICLENGARKAKNGEFTFRAFVNGRIDLTEAEAINEIINADNNRMVYETSGNLTGALKEKVSSFREKILNLITSVESTVEFPMDVPDFDKNKFIKELKEINLSFCELIKNSKEGQFLREGIKISIVGAPNVGKSSLLNILLGNKRAIVSQEPGTTRDTIEEKTMIDEWPVVFVDTAGVREAKNLSEPEQIGIERTKNALLKSDIVLLLFDLSVGINDDTNRLFDLVNGKPKVLVGNKIDLLEKPFQDIKCNVQISAKYATNIDKLKKIIIERINSFTSNHGVQNSSSVLYINQRQKELLLQCNSSISKAIDKVQNNEPEDLISDDLKEALSRLDEVTGRKINDEIITNIFAKFCIGK
ncbi:MAG: tRNA uridine-5-carboxymethylaminomethyl(34) synthesis GTPase MnmE [Candidatus Melainabacteria bacterium RIFCSPHIGHO2_02_FULL_34_12]|nr:MAG: tRNA uridine-5-carboxymethylaminomethyl(34) synthesis GTPase MnmE [Candidatus Melainabacteria bacterium RIFCSPHIGHO2_02_FULL_34_12]